VGGGVAGLAGRLPRPSLYLCLSATDVACLVASWHMFNAAFLLTSDGSGWEFHGVLPPGDPPGTSMRGCAGNGGMGAACRVDACRLTAAEEVRQRLLARRDTSSANGATSSRYAPRHFRRGAFPAFPCLALLWRNDAFTTVSRHF